MTRRPWSRLEFALLVRAYRTPDRSRRQRLLESLAVRRDVGINAVAVRASTFGLTAAVRAAQRNSWSPREIDRLRTVYAIPDFSTFSLALGAFASAAGRTRNCCAVTACRLGIRRASRGTSPGTLRYHRLRRAAPDRAAEHRESFRGGATA